MKILDVNIHLCYLKWLPKRGFKRNGCILLNILKFILLVGKYHLFFSACNCIYLEAEDTDEIVNLSLQESFCLPVLTCAVAILKLTVRHKDELNACWKTV
jgi:hypothetical protein